MKNKKVENKKVEKVEKKSIARIVMAFIKENNLLKSDNRKGKYDELLKIVLKEFPNSAFKKTHYFWYISRYQRQVNEGLGTDHLISSPKEEKKVEKKEIKKVVKKVLVKK